jgi:hypothetical protein
VALGLAISALIFAFVQALAALWLSELGGVNVQFA